MEKEIRSIIEMVKGGVEENFLLIEGFVQGRYKKAFENFNVKEFFLNEFGVEVSRKYENCDKISDLEGIMVGLLMLGGLPLNYAKIAIWGIPYKEVKINLDGCGGLASMYDYWAMNTLEEIISKYKQNIIEVGFKYLVDEKSKSPLLTQNKFIKKLGLELCHTYTHGETVKEIFVAKDNVTYFEFQKNGIGICSYSSMYSFDITKGMKILNTILGGKTNIHYLKDINIFDNGLANCNIVAITDHYNNKQK